MRVRMWFVCIYIIETINQSNEFVPSYQRLNYRLIRLETLQEANSIQKAVSQTGDKGKL